MTAKILIVDDEEPLLRALSRELERAGHACIPATNGTDAIEAVRERTPSMIILDVHLPDMSGLELLRRFKSELPEVPALIITAYGSVDSAVEAMKEGAIDYLEKPLDLEELCLVVDRELRNARLESEVEAYRRETQRQAADQPLLGNAPSLGVVRDVVRRIQEVEVESAAELPTVLIEGETGTGKGLLAHQIHLGGPLAERPFVTVNCSGLPRELVESELFGHEKGAFTGAAQRKKGLFEVARGGTIFLDEIGDMPLESQARLLRVIESRAARRVGGTREYQADVHVIAATNRDLQSASTSGAFRSDLYYRLKVVAVEMPPLRERTEDISLLSAHFLERFRAKYRKPDLELDPSTLRNLEGWSWPGNVRELAHTIEQLVLLSDGRTLPRPPFVGARETMTPPPAQPASSDVATASTSRFDDDLRLDSIERRTVETALERANGNVSEAARLLGLSRGALRHRIEKWGLEPTDPE